MSLGWTQAEMGAAKVRDQRSRLVLGDLCERLAENPETSFSSAVGPAGRQAARRVFRRKDSAVTSLLAGHYQATAARCRQQELVLVAQDTTEFNYARHPATTGLGPLTLPGHQGLLGHAALALTATGEPLGLLDVALWHRDAAPPEATVHRRQRACAEKESPKWVTALAAVGHQLPTGPEVLLIQDREGDVFDFLATPRRPGLHLLVRAAQARKVILPAFPERPAQTLFAVAAAAPEVGTLSVRLPAKAAKSGRPAQLAREEREATLTVRLTRLTIQPPQGRKGSATWTPQTVWVIHATEEAPPAGLRAKEVVRWVLLTTRPVETGAEALTHVGYYALRWRIERLHYTLKSGCEVEQLQIETGADLQKALALYYVVAWRLLWLTYVARTQPETPAAEVLSEPELIVLRKATKLPVTTAQEAVRAIARLAGWRGYRRVPDPGVKMLWRGWRRLSDMVRGWQLTDPIQA